MAANEQMSLFDHGAGNGFASTGVAAPPVIESATRLRDAYGGKPGVGSRKACIPERRPEVIPPGSEWVEIETATRYIGFLLRTSRRKTIGLTINDDGLLVTMPTWATRKQLHDAVNAKAPWILRKLTALYARQEQLAIAEARWKDGGSFPYLGAKVELRLRPEAGSARFSGALHAPAAGDVLSLPLQMDSTGDRIRERVYTWLQNQAIAYFDARLAHYCKRAGVRLQNWRIASPAARWGSCSSDGRIMLNWRLIHFPPDVVDYVVAHEVAHLRHMNHGPDFWREVERLCPAFTEARRALKPHHPGSLPLL